MTISIFQLNKSRVIGKALALCGLSLAISSTLFAQRGFEFGIRYMVTKSSLYNNSDKNAGPELDYANTVSYLSGGFAGSFKFDRHLAVEMDILYSRQGQSYSGNDMLASNYTAYSSQVGLQAILNDKVAAGEYQAKAELNCIKIPFLFKVTTDNAKRAYASLSVGPQINIIKSAVYEVNHEDVLLPGINIEPNDVYRKVTMDGVVALGGGLNLTRHFSLTAQARFDYGFQDVEKKDQTFMLMGTSEKYYDQNRAATHNGTAALMVGVNYKL